MADTDQAKRDADKKEADRVAAEQKKLREEQAAKTPETPAPTQAEMDKINKEHADKAAKGAEARGAMAAEYYSAPETPTPTQAEMDAASSAAFSQQQLGEGSGLYKTPLQGAPEEQQRRKLEADKSGGYATRSTKPE